ncbi:ABC transporter substrate-binding protein [Methylocystis heyeri]|uniref:ABC transporter substrate-binding protein n=1 Tax=Methylocystis heyeri TaxID=391905 RepID=A0A6B8KK11_9HYPH|nr:ABC transporter substrate-binding protein [Methylocystis heyeri]QGM47889.1 ABC transporter substrate-binding protein [Methylocystis heyeri]
MRLLAFFIFCLAAIAPALAGDTREIVDMIGRRVTIPAKIERVYGSGPPPTLMLYALAPELLIGLNTPMKGDDKRLIRKEARDLPALGSQSGGGRQLNPEEILAQHPDIVIAWADRLGDNSKTEESFARIKLPVVFIKLDTLAQYAQSFRFLGELFDRKAKGDELAAYIDGALARVQKAVADIPAQQRLRVYYAESADGLATDCDKSFHAEPIILAGADNVYHCEQATHMGMEKIGLEQIIALRPDLILSQDHGFASSVTGTEGWRNVKAVQERRILAIPRAPFNWLDRPPSFMRALGIQWLANAFYPTRYPLDLKDETKKFYRLFLGVEIDDADFARLFN